MIVVNTGILKACIHSDISMSISLTMFTPQHMESDICRHSELYNYDRVGLDTIHLNIRWHKTKRLFPCAVCLWSPRITHWLMQHKHKRRKMEMIPVSCAYAYVHHKLPAQHNCRCAANLIWITHLSRLNQNTMTVMNTTNINNINCFVDYATLDFCGSLASKQGDLALN